MAESVGKLELEIRAAVTQIYPAEVLATAIRHAIGRIESDDPQGALSMLRESLDLVEDDIQMCNPPRPRPWVTSVDDQPSRWGR